MGSTEAETAIPLEAPANRPRFPVRDAWHAAVRLFDRLNGTGRIAADISASDYDDVQKITDT